MLENVFHHHHRAVHHHADGDGQATQGHEVGGQPPVAHGREGQADRKGHRYQHQQGGADIEQEQQQHHHDEHEGFAQSAADRVHRLFHQVGLVVEGFNGDAFGQRLLDGRQALLDGIDGGLGVGAPSLEHDACHYLAQGFGLAVFIPPGHGDGTLAYFTAERHGSDIADMDHHTILLLQGDVAYVLQAFLTGADPADATYDQLFRAPVEIPAAGIAVVVLDGLCDVIDMNAVGKLLAGIDLHLVLADLATVGEHFGDTVHGQEQQFHHPVVEATQGDGVVFFMVGGTQDVLIDLSQAGGVGPHFRGAHAFGDLLPGILQPFEYQLPCEVNIGAFLEHDGDHGQAGLGNRTYLLHIRQGVHHGLDGIGDQLFHLFRGQAFGFGVDLYLYVGDIRKGVEIEFGDQHACCTQYGDQAQHHQQAVGH